MANGEIVAGDEVDLIFQKFLRVKARRKKLNQNAYRNQMNPKKWQKIKELFNAAVDLAPAERETYLQNQNGTSKEILEEVRNLLAAEKERRFDKPIANVANLAQETSSENLVGRAIGIYKIVRELGYGGMGTVFLAEREDLQKQFAVKIIRHEFASENLLRRFKHEREILARLTHPNIANLLDGGTTETGLPYLVMEFVEGEDLLTFAKKRNLSVEEKLKIFRKIGAAVAYAHGKLIVHRDLKPTNILVTKDGEPKLLDFGISKLLDEENSAEKGTATQLGMMTPNYASPEQFRGESVSTATDVYSLGVILFELLTDALPYQITGKRIDEVARAVIEIEPERPSSVVFRSSSFADGKLTDENNGQKTEDERRKTNPKSKIRNPKFLKGDLDNIILKSLRKEPERRYSSIEKFSYDLRRHLEGLPVSARPDTFFYRLEKFVSRNRVAVFAGLLVFLTLICGIAATGWQVVRAERQRILAEKRFNQVRELANNVVFKYHDEIKDLPGATHIREVMVRDALKYLDNLQEDSMGDADLTRELALAFMRVGSVQGGAYQANLGDSAGAAESYEKAVKLLEPLAENSLDTKLLAVLRDAYIESSRAFYRTGAVARQNENLQKAFALSEKIVALEPDNIEPKIFYARSLAHFGDSLPESEMPRKMEIYRQSFKTADEIISIAPDDETANRMLATATHRMQMYIFLEAAAAKKNGDPEKQKSLLREALVYAARSTEAQQKVLAMQPGNSLFQRNVAGGKLNEGKIYRELGDTETALRMANEALKIHRQIAAEDANNQEIKLDLKESYEDLALAYIKRGEFSRASENFRQAVELNEQLLKKDPQNFDFWIARLRGEQIYADALLEKGEKQLAKKIYENAIIKAATETPKKYAEFIEEFQKEARESLQKCAS